MFSLLALLAAQSVPTTAPALPPPAVQAPDEVVVTGERSLTRQEVRQHVNEITEVRHGQLGRFFRPVCPTVIGLPADHAAIIEARFREVAESARIDLLPAPCAPNVNLIVVPSGREFVDRIRPHLYRHGLNTSEIRELVEETGPVRLWRRTQWVNEHLQATPREGGYVRVYSTSIISQPGQIAINEVFLVLDDAAVVGKSLTQLADYFAMRALAETEAPREPGQNAGTILTLFEPNAQPPASATTVDIGYLGGLYHSAATRRVDQQRQRISTMIARELQQQQRARDD